MIKIFDICINITCYDVAHCVDITLVFVVVGVIIGLLVIILVITLVLYSFLKKKR